MSCSTRTHRETFVDGERYGQLTNLCGHDDAHTPVVGSTCLHVLIHVLIDIWDDIKWMEDGKRYFRENVLDWRHSNIWNTINILFGATINLQTWFITWNIFRLGELTYSYSKI